LPSAAIARRRLNAAANAVPPAAASIMSVLHYSHLMSAFSDTPLMTVMTSAEVVAGQNRMVFKADEVGEFVRSARQSRRDIEGR
jgi:hypothetical protein